MCRRKREKLGIQLVFGLSAPRSTPDLIVNLAQIRRLVLNILATLSGMGDTASITRVELLFGLLHGGRAAGGGEESAEDEDHEQFTIFDNPDSHTLGTASRVSLYLEREVQASLNKISAAMEQFRRWANAKGLLPRESRYVSQTRDRRTLGFSRCPSVMLPARR